MKQKTMAITQPIAAGKKNPSIRDAVRPEFYESIAEILRTARSKAYRAVNFTMVEAYWNLGRMIVEEEQHGKNRAGYGQALLKNLAERLTIDFGKGFIERNLRYFRQFYLWFPIRNALRSESSKGQKSDNPEPIRYALRSELGKLNKIYA